MSIEKSILKCKLVGLIGVLFASCASPPDQTSSRGVTYPVEVNNSRCSVHQISLVGESLGTAFALLENGSIFFVTAGHVVRGQDYKRLSLRNECGVTQLPIKEVLFAPQIDLAILTLQTDVPVQGLRLRQLAMSWGQPILVPNYANLNRGSVRLKNKIFPSSGKIVGQDENVLMMTLDVVQKGSSGAPIIDGDGFVAGIVTNRILIDGVYAGVSTGIDSQSIKTSIMRLADFNR